MIGPMDMQAAATVARAFFRRYRPWILVPFALGLVAVIVVVVMMNQGHFGGFQYSVFEGPGP